MSVLCLDVGTSAVKAAVIDPAGSVLASGSADYPTRRVAGGGVEQSPEDWWNASRTAIAACGEPTAAVRALSVTGQMQDLILLADGLSVRDALLYSDLRAGVEHAELTAAMPGWDDRAGTVQDQSNVAAKLLWLARHEPENLARATDVVFGPAGYLLRRAGAPAVCDLTTASATGLLDLPARDWNWPLVDATGIDRSLMPALIAEAMVIGELSDAAAADLGLPAGIALVCPPGDAGAATDGLIGDEPGSAYVYLGTTGWLAKISEPSARASAHPSMHRLAMPGWSELAIAAVLHAGSAVDWAHRTFLPGKSFAEIEALLQHERTSGMLCLPGLAGERSPVRDPHARGTYVGAGPDTRAEDFYLATLEGVAFAFKHVADELGLGPSDGTGQSSSGRSGSGERTGGGESTDGRSGSGERTGAGASGGGGVGAPLAAVGGGARSAAWRQVLADILDRPILALADVDAGTHSAARAAYRALGEPVPDPLAALVTDAHRVEPGPRAAQYRRLAPVHRDLYGTLAETFRRLSTATEPDRKDPDHA